MAENGFDCVASNLLCTETNYWCFDDLDSVNPEEQTHETNNQPLGFKDFGSESESEPFFGLPLQSEECLSFMAERERAYLPRDDYLKRLRSGELDLGMRKEALDWIWKVHAHFGFGPLSLWLSTNYLDRFLSVYQMPKDTIWATQLLAVACFSLAAKMEEVTVPQLVDLQIGEAKFVFEGITIERMELVVLNHLKWKLRAYTPFSFLDYFIRKINDDQKLSSGSLISRSIQLIISTTRGIDFLEFMPSEIAAAVAISVSAEVTGVTIDKALSCLTHVEEGRVVKCLDLIRDLPLVTIEASNVAAGASCPQSPIGVLDAAFWIYGTEDMAAPPCANSSPNSPEAKRRKLDQPFQEDLKS
ncbi:cyclin-D4-1-like [Diospyros lotus]|uniref:cyclin-D4-1-like n=1 Tax=Diospyros lotus TaxID=55363 RepID=UPI0022593E94|nr:cyclin-D4-1-like [Diospyros lotus]